MNWEESIGSLAAATGWGPSELLELDAAGIDFWTGVLNRAHQQG